VEEKREDVVGKTEEEDGDGGENLTCVEREKGVRVCVCECVCERENACAEETFFSAACARVKKFH